MVCGDPDRVRPVHTSFPAGAVIEREHVSMVPIQDELEEFDEPFLTFEEANARDELSITELDDTDGGPSVGRVKIVSEADYPVLFLAGEVLAGGKQHRMVATTTMVPADVGQLEMAVKCVERGRWSASRGEFDGLDHVAHSKMRRQASTRSSQSGVWDEVDETNRSRRASSPTSSYKKSVDDTRQSDRAQTFVEEFTDALEDFERADGVAVAFSGEVVAVETFGTRELFEGMVDRLVESYVLEASTVPRGDESIEPGDVDDFLKLAQDAAFVDAEQSGSAENNYYEADGLEGYVSYVDDRSVYAFYRRNPAAAGLS